MRQIRSKYLKYNNRQIEKIIMKSYFYGWVNYQNGLLLDEDKENINKNFSCN